MTEESDIIITSRELKRCGICVPGQQDWFEKHGMDFRDFVKNGIPASELLKTEDGMAIRAVNVARSRRVQETEN